MEGFQDSLGNWKVRNSEVCMGLWVCAYRCDDCEREKGDEEVCKLHE